MNRISDFNFLSTLLNMLSGELTWKRSKGDFYGRILRMWYRFGLSGITWRHKGGLQKGNVCEAAIIPEPVWEVSLMSLSLSLVNKNWHPLSVGFRLQSCCFHPPVAVVHFGGQISNIWQVHRRAFCWNLFQHLLYWPFLQDLFSSVLYLFIYLPCLHCGIMGKAASNQNHIKQKYLKSILTKNNMDIST